MKKILILIFMSLVITGCSFEEKSDITNSDNLVSSISYQEVKKIVDNYSQNPNVYIIDVRSEDEFVTGHIENAVNISLVNIDNIDINKDERLIVYCQSGRRSKEAALKLKDLGYENVSDMGGINNWPYELVVE